MDAILAAQHAFDTAELTADTARLDSLLTEDFQSIGERGHVLDKAGWIARHGEFRYLSVAVSETDVRLHPGAAIVRCVQRSRAVWRGTPLTLSTRVGHVWTPQPGGWQLAAIQFSTLAD